MYDYEYDYEYTCISSPTQHLHFYSTHTYSIQNYYCATLLPEMGFV